MLKPLLKWPGGKTRELPVLTNLLAGDYRRYVEPFVGGGACLFALKPAEAVINDVNPDLVGLYRAVRDDDPMIREKLSDLVDLWDVRIRRLTDAVGARLVDAFEAERGRMSEFDPRERAVASVLNEFQQFARGGSVCGLEAGKMTDRLRRSVVDKLRRVSLLEAKHGVVFSAAQLADHMVTAVRAGVYGSIRDDAHAGGREVDLARFFFIREYCYGSMFRFSKDGRFNIPYGGIAYNAKPFGRKVAALFDPERTRALQPVEIANEDFRSFFARRAAAWGPETLVFLDPPYDTDFSDYDRFAFDMGCQRALADIVVGLRATFILVIKDTPAIRDLYEPRAAGRYVIENYAKRYTYNVRGRNTRDVTHLVIHNVV